jgi:hypothetical protein
VQQVDIKFYICNKGAQKTYSIESTVVLNPVCTVSCKYIIIYLNSDGNILQNICYNICKMILYSPYMTSWMVCVYQEYFLGGKGGQCVGLITLPPSCATCLEMWEPQTPATLRACTGIALLY